MVIKVYYLRQLKDTEKEWTEGEEFISQAISETTEDPSIRRIVIEENTNLDVLALQTEVPSQRDLDNYVQLPKPSPLARSLEAKVDDLTARIEKLERK